MFFRWSLDTVGCQKDDRSKVGRCCHRRSPSHLNYLSFFNLGVGDDAIFALLYFFFGLVKLRLNISALFQSGEICLILRKSLKGRKLFIKLQEGVQVSTEYNLLLGQIFIQQKQVLFQFFDLRLFLLFFGAEMGTDEDVVISADNCKTFPPFLNLLSALIISDVTANLTEVSIFTKRAYF
jgi:hypothetical protein